MKFNSIDNINCFPNEKQNISFQINKTESSDTFKSILTDNDDDIIIKNADFFNTNSNSTSSSSSYVLNDENVSISNKKNEEKKSLFSNVSGVYKSLVNSYVVVKKINNVYPKVISEQNKEKLKFVLLKTIEEHKDKENNAIIKLLKKIVNMPEITNTKEIDEYIDLYIKYFNSIIESFLDNNIEQFLNYLVNFLSVSKKDEIVKIIFYLLDIEKDIDNEKIINLKKSLSRLYNNSKSCKNDDFFVKITNFVDFLNKNIESKNCSNQISNNFYENRVIFYIKNFSIQVLRNIFMLDNNIVIFIKNKTYTFFSKKIINWLMSAFERFKENNSQTNKI